MTETDIATKMVMITMIVKKNVIFNAIYVGGKLKIFANNESISQSNDIFDRC